MFDSVLGHLNIKKRLEEQILTSQVSHAYIFYGKEGIGKQKLANAFAKELLGADNLLASPDYKYICKADGKTDILVEQIREQIISDINIVPAASKYKVYIIDDADKMNESAQSSLLKTLEEPPKYVVIILISRNLNSFLPTVISRTNNIHFGDLTKEDIKGIIGRDDIDNNILMEADGSAKKAISLLDEKSKEMYDKIKILVETIGKKQKIELILKLQEIDFKTADIEYIQKLLLQEKNYTAVRYFEEAKLELTRNANEEMVKTALAIRLCK